MNIHRHYDQLSADERRSVDYAFSAAMSVLRDNGVRLIGDDRAERAVDALARAVIESRT